MTQAVDRRFRGETYRPLSIWRGLCRQVRVPATVQGRRRQREPAIPPARVSAILAAAAARHGLSPIDLYSSKRVFTKARDEAIHDVRQITLANGKTPSLPLIGQWFGRDHSSVLSALRRHAQRMGEGA